MCPRPSDMYVNLVHQSKVSPYSLYPSRKLSIFQLDLPILAFKSLNTRYMQNVMPITFDSLLIGRSKSCTVVVAHQCVSRFHCSIRLSGGGLAIRNLRFVQIRAYLLPDRNDINVLTHSDAIATLELGSMITYSRGTTELI